MFDKCSSKADISYLIHFNTNFGFIVLNAQGLKMGQMKTKLWRGKNIIKWISEGKKDSMV